jgi:hypothetical protein
MVQMAKRLLKLHNKLIGASPPSRKIILKQFNIPRNILPLMQSNVYLHKPIAITKLLKHDFKQPFFKHISYNTELCYSFSSRT